MVKKVVVRLEGGLGNQLHQYAYGLMVAKKTRADLYLDIQFLVKYSKKLNVTYRDYELNKFDVSSKYYESFLSNQLVLRFIKKFKILNKILNFYGIKVVSDHVALEQLNCDDMKLVYLHGIMGDYSDYKDDTSYIINNLRINSKYNSILDTVKERIDNSNSVSIHIRRTDYLKKGSIHHVLDIDYYSRAINLINSKVENPKFFIFSDDSSFVKDNFNIDNNVFNYIDYSDNDAAFFDFLAIKQCKHHILANSTFSWWASFLGTRENDICIVPSFNLITEKLVIEESFPSTWIVI